MRKSWVPDAKGTDSVWITRKLRANFIFKAENVHENKYSEGMTVSYMFSIKCWNIICLAFLSQRKRGSTLIWSKFSTRPNSTIRDGLNGIRFLQRGVVISYSVDWRIRAAKFQVWSKTFHRVMEWDRFGIPKSVNRDMRRRNFTEKHSESV